MKKVLFLIVFLAAATGSITAQNRQIARGAEPGELYFSSWWYGIFNPYEPSYDTLKRALFRLTENGKKLTIQYSVDIFSGIEYIAQPVWILADATPGVVYGRDYYGKNWSTYTALWVSFDYGKNWTFREELPGQVFYYAANFEGLIYRGGEGVFKSKNYGHIFTQEYGANYCHDCDMGMNEKELFSVGTEGLYQGRLFHTHDFFRTYTQTSIDSQFVFTNADVYRGGFPSEVYISSWFPEYKYKVSYSADTGRSFRQVYLCDDCNPYNGELIWVHFMSDREPGVFYIVKNYNILDTDHQGHHVKLCIDYYRDYGETFVDTYCHDLTKDYPTAIGDISAGSMTVQVYPNPTKIEFKVQSLKFKVENVEIFDVFGRAVGVYPCGRPERTTPPFGHPSNNGGEFTIDISNVPTGMYFFRITTENGIINRKIVKY